MFLFNMTSKFLTRTLTRTLDIFTGRELDCSLFKTSIGGDEECGYFAGKRGDSIITS